MTKAYIYNMAMSELLRKVEKEEERLKAKPDSQITLKRIEKYKKEIEELHELILQEEASKDGILLKF